MNKLVVGLLLMFMLSMPIACAKEIQPDPSPPSPLPPASSPSYPNHGITTTKIEPKPGESVTIGSGAIVRFTIDDLVEKADTVLIGKVVDIFPSRQVDKPPWIVITDVVIEVERYLYGQPQSPQIAVMVPGGRVGESIFLVDEQPVFNLGEEVALFLYRLQSEITPQADLKLQNITESLDPYRVNSATVMVLWLPGEMVQLLSLRLSRR